jgi:WD40 repeat protein
MPLRARVIPASARLAAFLAIAAAIAACGDSVEPGTVAQGVLRVSVTPGGVDLDPNGYVLHVGKFAAREIPSQGSEETFVSDPGALSVSLSGMAGNCNLAGADTTVSVTAGDTTEIALAVTCVALPGVLHVSVTTTGDDPPYGGYLVLAGADTVGRAGYDGTTRLAEVPPGDQNITLADVASNCTVAEPAGVPSTISASAEAHVDFTVSCVHTDRIAFDSLNTIFTSNLDETGAFRLLSSPGRDARTPDWSPDGSRIVSASWAGGLYIADADGSNVVWLDVGDVAYQPAWSPDGSRLAFGTTTATGLHIVTTNLAGGDVRELTHGTTHDYDPSWSPDGTRLVFTREVVDTSRRLFLINADGSNLVQLTDGLDDGEAAWSPDGTLIAYTAQGPIEPQVRLVHPDGTGDVLFWPDDAYTAGSSPVWSSDGSVLLIRSDTTYVRIDLASRAVTDTLGVHSLDVAWRH